MGTKTVCVLFTGGLAFSWKATSLLLLFLFSSLLFAEKLNDVRDFLVRNVKVDELLLSCMTEKSVISAKDKIDIQRVCASLLTLVLLFLGELGPLFL